MNTYYVEKKYRDCRSEQDFKISYIKDNYSSLPRGTKVFCVETEETVAGFPDVMTLMQGNIASFYEFKFSDRYGKIKFQPTQPAFYKMNPEMNVRVIAYNKKTGVLHKFSAELIFDKNSGYKINPRAEINLCNVEKKVGV